LDKIVAPSAVVLDFVRRDAFGATILRPMVLSLAPVHRTLAGLRSAVHGAGGLRGCCSFASAINTSRIFITRKNIAIGCRFGVAVDCELQRLTRLAKGCVSCRCRH
jgi:hypothetical protein